MIAKVQKLLNHENHNNSSPKFIKLRKDILQHIEQGQSTEKKNPSSVNVNYIEPKVPMQKIFCETLSLDDIDEEEIARQLTLYEYDLFVAIGLEELMSFGWKRLKFKHRCPNINKLLIHFENVTKWISFSICKPKSKNPIKRCISICEHLKKLNNFNTLKAILNAFEYGEVKTLKINQSEQANKMKFQQLMSEESNYQEYRQTLKESSEENTSIIPYVRLHLRDLFLVEENQNDFVIGPNSIEFINWMKRESMYDIVKEIKYFQSLPCYQFTKVYQIQELLRNIQIE
ncbi:rasGEF domain-containing protein [Naegleria gruberi]|nr:rasGEF domain-containing protein [Naegleria gruberi]EFC35485.1 rasGEF domain-containing protein [Naegleria gruberi]|eukprot:XP_002668229.1 rasGEF domain-containing protein [Naegleria gruberi strain NEG-M]